MFAIFGGKGQVDLIRVRAKHSRFRLVERGNQRRRFFEQLGHFGKLDAAIVDEAFGHEFLRRHLIAAFDRCKEWRGHRRNIIGKRDLVHRLAVARGQAPNERQHQKNS